MNEARTEILNWLVHGRLLPAALPTALRLAGITPARADWHRFFDRLTLWLGVIFLAAAVVFFFAYNWETMGRYAKFGLIELLICATAVLCWRLDLDQMAGKAMLLLASLLIGGLLALVGQTYQTGADTFELFAAWAVAILPLVAVSRLGGLWLFWIGLLNLALILYYKTFLGLFWFNFELEKLLWALLALDTLALCIWESAARRGTTWLCERWPVRILIAASGSLVTALALCAIFEFHPMSAIALLAYFLWMALAYAVYRYRLRDAFALAGAVLSGIIVIASFLSKHMLSHYGAGAFLFIGMVVIGLSAAGGLWLKSMAQEERP
jgi:uncharacterized membrane protein